MEEQARKDLIEKAERTHRLSPEELAALLADAEAEEELAAAADRVRHAFVGDEVHLRGLIEFSSYCRQNCLYCGLRRDNGKAQRYRLSPEEIVALAAKAKAYGYYTAVMQSGEDPWFTAERLADIVRDVKRLGNVRKKNTAFCGRRGRIASCFASRPRIRIFMKPSIRACPMKTASAAWPI